MVRQLQQGPRDSGQWFRVGIVSATMVTPLLSRWRSLRAAERARTLWETSRANTQWPWASPAGTADVAATGTAAVGDPPPAPPRASVRPGLWLAGVGVGLVVAGAAAYVIARRRLQANEAPVEMPWPVGANGHGQLSDTLAQSGQALFSRAPAGATLDPAADAGAAQFYGDPEFSAGRTPAVTIPLATQSAALENEGTGVASPLQLDGDDAPIVGNTRTLVYHEASDTNLPAPEHRVFFASAAQAQEQGYHPVRGSQPESSLDQHEERHE